MLKLKSFEVLEHLNDDLYWHQEKTEISDYNLIIGDNASGKSQFFNRLEFLKILHTKGKETQNIITNVNFKLEFRNVAQEIISYEVTVRPNQQVEENITNETQNAPLFRWKDKAFLDETSKEIKNLLLPTKISVTKLVEDYPDSYRTINQIGDFLSNIKIIRADRFDPGDIIIDPDQFEPDSRLKNLGAVILNWKKKLPEAYEVLLKETKRIFSFIEDFTETKEHPKGVAILGLKEADISYPISQFSLSGGLLRAMGIIASSIYKNQKTGEPAPLIIIDEIDNGLSYEKVGQLIDFIKDRSDLTQFLFSSHSPITCNFTEPPFWRVFNRNRLTVKVTTPTNNKETVDLINSAKLSNWEIYKGHISKSKLYRIK